MQEVFWYHLIGIEEQPHVGAKFSGKQPYLHLGACPILPTVQISTRLCLLLKALFLAIQCGVEARMLWLHDPVARSGTAREEGQDGFW